MFEEDGDFVELDRSPSRFDMPANQGALDDFLLGNTKESDIKEIPLKEKSKEESKMAQQEQERIVEDAVKRKLAFQKKGPGAS